MLMARGWMENYIICVLFFSMNMAKLDISHSGIGMYVFTSILEKNYLYF